MRIRTIKPEFWVSESVGRLSRDARLLFIGLWSFADDSGRGRGALPAISGTLFPYDSDASELVGTWFAELEREGMVRRYKADDGNCYYDLPKWLSHQKIEKPSKSKFPAFPEPSPTIPRTLPDMSPLEQGTGNREQGTGTREQGTGKGKWKTAPIVAAYLDEFNLFWSAYPRKEAKVPALKSWNRIFSIGLEPAEPIIAAIMSGLNLHKQSAQWHDTKYIPHASTWLNQRRWEETPIVPAPSSQSVAAPDGTKDYSGPKW